MTLPPLTSATVSSSTAKKKLGIATQSVVDAIQVSSLLPRHAGEHSLGAVGMVRMRRHEIVQTENTCLCLQAVIDFLEEYVGVSGLLLAACAPGLPALVKVPRAKSTRVRLSLAIV